MLLKSAKALILELSLVAYNIGSPLFGDIVSYLNEQVLWQPCTPHLLFPALDLHGLCLLTVDCCLLSVVHV